MSGCAAADALDADAGGRSGGRIAPPAGGVNFGGRMGVAGGVVSAARCSETGDSAGAMRTVSRPGVAGGIAMRTVSFFGWLESGINTGGVLSKIAETPEFVTRELARSETVA